MIAAKRKHSKLKLQLDFTSMEDGIRGVDLIYMTRIQRERFANEEDYLRVKGKFVLNASLLNAAAPAPATAPISSKQSNKDGVHNKKPTLNVTLFLASRTPRPIVMHPMPIVDEIDSELDYDDRGAYLRQAENGLYVRMALLTMMLRESCEL